MYCVYVLLSSKDGKMYTGRTSNLRKRVAQHNNGEVSSTKNRRPLRLIFCEAYLSKNDAVKRELFLKTGRGREVLKKQINMSLIKARDEMVS